MLYVGRDALQAALPQIGRHALFQDLLMMRYVAPDATALSVELRAPTSGFADAVRAYAGLRVAPTDPSTPGWRLHDSVDLAGPHDYFFALAGGGRGKQKRWKQGGEFYARSGLHTRLYDGVPTGLAGCVARYSRLPGEGDGAEGRWLLEFDPGFAANAFHGLLDGQPIPFWPFALWMVRTVALPHTDPEDALHWIETTVIGQTRIGAGLVAADEDQARANGAWFFVGERPDPAQIFVTTQISDGELRDVCERFDPPARDVVAASVPLTSAAAAGPTTPAMPAPAAAPIDVAEPPPDLESVLLDAGGGRRLRIEPEVLASTLTHLSLGRHLLLVGPPGTGKSTLAANVCRAARLGLITGVPQPAAARFTTASATWSTFDTVGGYVPSAKGELVFRPGVFLRAFRERAWLAVDELNRADVDRAFGPLITLLAGGAEIQELPFETDGAGGTRTPVRIVPSARAEGTPAAGDFVVPDGWRMIGTMNTYDKSSLFRLSYAFMRRFALVYVGVGDLEEMIEAAGDVAVLAEGDERRLRSLLQACQIAGRALGMAFAIDIARYVELARGRGDVAEPFLDAIVAHVLPQLDVLEPEALRKLRDALLEHGVVPEGARGDLRDVFANMLELER